MIILDIEKPKRCGKCPMRNDGNDYCKLAHDHASFVRAKGCPIQEPKTGHWIITLEDWNRWTCSECGYTKRTDVHVDLGYNYCPKCGAKMSENPTSSESDGEK